MQLDKGKFRCPGDGDEQVKAPRFRPNLGQIDMEVPDRIALEVRPFGLVACGVGQPGNTMPLEAAVQ